MWMKPLRSYPGYRPLNLRYDTRKCAPSAWAVRGIGFYRRKILSSGVMAGIDVAFSGGLEIISRGGTAVIYVERIDNGQLMKLVPCRLMCYATGLWIRKLQ